jgi:YidC/Oxa1 family membrane protein insertase
MPLWDQSVEILRESIFAYAQMCNGNLGAGILAVTFLARLALLPLGVRLANAAAAQQRVMARVQPELDVLRKKYKDSPRRLAEETSRVMTRERISPLSLPGCLGSLAQVPVFIALYSGVQQAAKTGGRFLWIRDLAEPDWIVAIAATLFTALATAAGGAVPNQNRSLMLTISVVVTIAALSKMAAGVGLYWGMSSLFSAVQGWAVQRSLRSTAA